MKKYQSHKVVKAAVIVMHTDGLVVVCDPDGTEHPVTVPANFSARGGPCNGDYLVRYDDGYLSWSPKAVFEAGYREVAGTPAAVEVTVTAPPGKRAVIVVQRDAGEHRWTVPGGQSQVLTLAGDDVLLVNEGEPHSTVDAPCVRR